MEKTSKIVKSEFSNTWNPPSGQTLYVFILEFENGDSGKLYLKTPQNIEYNEGKVVQYSIDAKSKVSIVKSNENGIKKVFSIKSIDAAGMGFSYAKDIVVAMIHNKQKVEIEEISTILIKIAEPIVLKINELDKMLKSNDTH